MKTKTTAFTKQIRSFLLFTAVLMFAGTNSAMAQGWKIAFETIRGSDREIYLMNADGSLQTNLTNHPVALNVAGTLGAINPSFQMPEAASKSLIPMLQAGESVFQRKEFSPDDMIAAEIPAYDLSRKIIGSLPSLFDQSNGPNSFYIKPIESLKK